MPKNILYRSVAEPIKADRRYVAGSIPGRARRPSRSEISAVFSETRLNTDWESLRMTSKEFFTPAGLGQTYGQLVFILKPNSVHI